MKHQHSGKRSLRRKQRGTDLLVTRLVMVGPPPVPVPAPGPRRRCKCGNVLYDTADGPWCPRAFCDGL